MQESDANLPQSGQTLGAKLIAVCVGNTRTRVALLSDGQVTEAESVENSIPGGAESLAKKMLASSEAPAFVLASVNKPFAGKLELALASAADVYVVGRDLEIPIRHSLDDDSTVGQDRLLDALGAFSQVKEACVVVDLGTAITIDFVDGEGTFHGGVIAPGIRAMLHAMHETTSALPALEYSNPDPERGPFGKDTNHAMLLGVRNAVIGLVHQTIEAFAEKYGAFPLAIATGGDASILEGDPHIDRFVPDLQMHGVAAVCRDAISGSDENELE